MSFRANLVVLVLVFCAVLVSFSDAQGSGCGKAPRRENPPGWFRQIIEDFKASVQDWTGKLDRLFFGGRSLDLRSLDRRIVNGESAYRGQYPWQAGLWIDKQHWCGGTIIGRTWILTAAHCFDLSSQPWRWSVTVGDHHLSDDTEQDDRHEVEAVYIHPSWKNRRVDLALMELKTPINYDDFVQPACLPRPDAHPRSSHCYISGWGDLVDGAEKGSKVLMGAEVKIESKEDCTKYIKETWPLLSNLKDSEIEKEMCAGHKGTVDTCQGDSGGPLVCQEGDGYTVFGVTSHGQVCGSPDHPGVYVTVSKHLQFIHDVMGQ